MSKRVGVYARVSTTRQAERDISIPDQLAQARKYCESRGWMVVREFVDAGASARDDKRPEFQAAIEMACVDPSPFDVILVHSQSRFFRDTPGYVFYKQKLQKHGVSLISMTQDFGEGPSAVFAETIIAAADALSSAETAKHVTRTMLENARQGFWNGSKPPFGYRTVIAEQRGQRIKKRLDVEPMEAETVRLIYRLFLVGEGRQGPMGVRAIVSWLNANELRNRGGDRFYTSAVHAILTRETYTGIHHYNRIDSRTRRGRPKEEWIAVPVPQIIPVKDFKRVQERLHCRRPANTAPRLVNSNVLLTGIARCASCGGALMLRTGKGGRYRYYACAARMLKGRLACKRPIAIPEGQLNMLVIGALADQLLKPDRLSALLREAQQHRKAIMRDTAQRRASLNKRIKEADRRMDRLYAALADGTVTDTFKFRRTLMAFEAEREECIRLLSLVVSDAPALRQTLSKSQAQSVAITMKRRLLEAPPALQRRYVHGLVSEIVVDREKAVISGPPTAIAAAASSGAFGSEVRGLVREWWASTNKHRTT
jgi:site-specific DNA recombinase